MKKLIKILTVAFAILFIGLMTNENAEASSIKELKERVNQEVNSSYMLQDNEDVLVYLGTDSSGHYFFQESAEYEPIIKVGLEYDIEMLSPYDEVIGVFADNDLWELKYIKYTSINYKNDKTFKIKKK